MNQNPKYISYLNQQEIWKNAKESHICEPIVKLADQVNFLVQGKTICISPYWLAHSVQEVHFHTRKSFSLLQQGMHTTY